MDSRLDITKYMSSGMLRAMLALSSEVEAKMDRRLCELVKIRASQINGCAYCIDMHTKDARAAGEAEQRIYALNAWRETPFFTDRERAALEWTEAELVALTFAVVVINSWNRLSVSFRPPVGGYRPRTAAVSA